MASKRANGEGTIVKVMRNGVHQGWRASISVGYDSQGKQKRKQFTAKTQGEVKKKLEEYKKEMLLGTVSSNDKITLSEWYYTWLFDYRIKDLKPKSFEKYEGIYRNYIQNSELGRIKLKDLRATHIQKYYNKLQEQDNKPPSTIKGINTRLKTCLNEAEKQEYIQKNYCKMVTLPKVETTTEIQVLSEQEQQLFVQAIQGHKIEMLFLIALGTGLRSGELRGLKWSDIDINASKLKVNRTLSRAKNQTTGIYEIIEQSPKTKNSKREIPIPINILSKLKEYKKEQSKHRLLVGESYINNNYVFADDIGNPIDDKRPGRNLKTILTKLGIDPIKFHALRHTYATRLFEKDVPPKTVQVLMGHSDISITLDIYTHVMDDKKLEAVEQIDNIFII